MEFLKAVAVIVVSIPVVLGGCVLLVYLAERFGFSIGPGGGKGPGYYG